MTDEVDSRLKLLRMTEEMGVSLFFRKNSFLFEFCVKILFCGRSAAWLAHLRLFKSVRLDLKRSGFF